MPKCDGHSQTVAAVFVCACHRCLREPQEERFFACADGPLACAEATKAHTKVRGFYPEWQRMQATKENGMNFSEALTLAKTDRLRIARKLWSTPEWHAQNGNHPERLVYLVALDSRAFGAPASAALLDSPLGPLVRVVVYGLEGEPVVRVASHDSLFEDMLATDWQVVDDDTVAAVAAACVKKTSAKKKS